MKTPNCHKHETGHDSTVYCMPAGFFNSRGRAEQRSATESGQHGGWEKDGKGLRLVMKTTSN